MIYLYGILETNEQNHFGPIGFVVNGHSQGEVRVVARGDIGAVIGPAPRQNFEGLSKEELVKDLLAHQATLETIMKNRFVLPCKFGTLLQDEKEAKTLLVQYKTLLNEGLAKMRNCREFGLTAAWNTHRILNEIAEKDGQIIAFKNRFSSLPAADQAEAKVALGKILAKKLKEEASRYEKQILVKLKKTAPTYTLHDWMNDAMVFNGSFLLRGEGEASFFRMLEEMDKEWEGKLCFKCIGPLPPHSFATVTITRFDEEQIRRAEALLDIHGTINQILLKKAYKAKARTCHPDTRPHDASKKFETLNEAYKLLTDYCESGCRLTGMRVSGL